MHVRTSSRSGAPDMQVSYIMSCDTVYHDAAQLAAAEAGNALRMYSLVPGRVIEDGQGRRVPMTTVINHWKVRSPSSPPPT